MELIGGIHCLLYVHLMQVTNEPSLEARQSMMTVTVEVAQRLQSMLEIRSVHASAVMPAPRLVLAMDPSRHKHQKESVRRMLEQWHFHDRYVTELCQSALHRMWRLQRTE